MWDTRQKCGRNGGCTLPKSPSSYWVIRTYVNLCQQKHGLTETSHSQQILIALFIFSSFTAIPTLKKTCTWFHVGFSQKKGFNRIIIKSWFLLYNTKVLKKCNKMARANFWNQVKMHGCRWISWSSPIFHLHRKRRKKRSLSPVVPPPGNVNAEMTPGNLADRKSSP